MCLVAAAVTVLAWNEKHQKLTSGDESGLIIVWVLVKGNSFAGCISSAADHVFTASCCIIYELFITSAKEVMFLPEIVCLCVSKITQKVMEGSV